MLDDNRIAELAKALSHPARVRIVRMLAAQSECAGASIFSELPLAQSTVSEHLRVLKSAGLVHGRSVGSATVYCVESGPLSDLAAYIAHVAAETPSCSSAGKGGSCS